MLLLLNCTQFLLLILLNIFELIFCIFNTSTFNRTIVALRLILNVYCGADSRRFWVCPMSTALLELDALAPTCSLMSKLPCIHLSLCSYVMVNAYKPAPLDLNHVKLTPNQNQLVEKLAENGHNVWARDRVRQGWTYSIVQVRVWCSVCSSERDVQLFIKCIFFAKKNVWQNYILKVEIKS